MVLSVWTTFGMASVLFGEKGESRGIGSGKWKMVEVSHLICFKETHSRIKKKKQRSYTRDSFKECVHCL